MRSRYCGWALAASGAEVRAVFARRIADPCYISALVIEK
jgi:hypothetical protein